VGLRFRPTDKEIVVDYLRPKNSDRDTSHVDRVISTVTIRSFDPWELPCKCFHEFSSRTIGYFLSLGFFFLGRPV